MPRIGFWAGLSLLALGCSKNAPSKPEIPPWQVLVTGVRPGHAAAPPRLVVCSANGQGCAPIERGSKLTGNKLVRAEHGVSEFQLDSATHVEIAEGSELLLDDSHGRALELRSGGVVLSRTGEVSDAGPLLLRMVDRTLELVGRTSLVAQLDDIHRGQIFVASGVVTAVEPAGTAPPVRKLRPGEGALFENQAPAELDALFRGAVSRFRNSVLAVVETPPPPKRVVAPRGLGTMTARVPGTTAVVTGVRLAQHHVRAEVRDGVAQTEVEEVFQNDTDRVLEGRYVFPLPADATISGLTLFVNEKPVDGEVVEKKRAATIFKNIVDDTVRPRDPALLEWVRGSEFSLKVFPIPAHGSRKVVLRYQQVLTSDGPRQVYSYPLSFGAERRTPIDELSIDIELSDAGQPALAVVASGYPASVEARDKTTHVALRATRAEPDHDFVVSFRRPAPTLVTGTAEQGFVALRLRAELPQGAPEPAFQRRDRVLVVDTSQSQSAEALSAAEQLARGILSNLEPSERFALLLCDSACEAVPPSGLAAASSKNVDEAIARLRAKKPAGASDLAGALLAAARRVPKGEAVQVVYVGDGSPSAGELSLSRVVARLRPSFQQRQVDLRLLGAGPSVDEVFLNGLARELGGSYDAVASAGPLAEQVDAVTLGLRSPLLLAPSLELPAAVTELEPRVLPNLRLGEELVVVGKLSGEAPLTATLRGRLGGSSYTLVRPVAVQRPTSPRPFAPRLWAESRIRELTHSSEPSAEKELIQISKQFRVMSRETSWLVLENERMFADLGIERTRETLNALEPEPPQAEARSELARALDEQAPEAPAADSSDAAPRSEAKSSAAQEAEKPRSAPPKKAPAEPTPAPAAPAAGPGGLGNLGSGSSGSLDDLSGSAKDGSGASGAVGSTTGPRSNVSVGGVTVSGGAISNAPRVVAGMRAGLRACHQRALNEDPTSAGKARLSLTVGTDGKVTGASVTPSGPLSPSLLACVKARARAATFAPPEGGNAVLLVPIQFTIQSPVLVDPKQPPGALAPRPAPRPLDTASSRPGDDSWLTQGQAAIDKLQAELAKNPESRKANEALVRGLLSHGRFAAALKAAEHFVELDPDLASAREVLAYAAVATGNRALAAQSLDAMVEAAPSIGKVHARVARAYESLGDEPRACAHWRSLAELAPSSDAALFESLRCRAKAMDDREAALSEARGVSKKGPLLARLLPLLASGNVPAFASSSGSAGQFEAKLECQAERDCPYVVVITPTGTVFSPWTPAVARSSTTSFAFTGLLTGVYRVMLVGGAPGASGQVQVRALNVRNVFAFGPGKPRTVAFTQVKMAPIARPGSGLLNVF